MNVQQKPWMLVSILLALAIAGIGSYFAFVYPTGNSSSTISGQTLPDQEPETANTITTHAYLGQPDDFSNEFDRSDIVVEGVVTELFDARWTTKNGKAPAEITKDVAKNPAIQIRTPVELKVERVFKGNPGGTIKFSFVGGHVGDVAYESDWTDVIQKDARLIVFLSKGDDDSPPHLADPGALFPTVHLLVKGDVAQGPTDEISMEELEKQLK